MFGSFADYFDIKPINAETTKALASSSRFIAKEKLKSRPDDSTYTDRWFLLPRKRLFDAEVEKAMAEIDEYFLGYSTQVEIIKVEADFYIASREIARFKTWAECRDKIKLLNDGTLVLSNGNKTKMIKGLGTVCTYADFFRGSDPHSGNFGIQENDNDCVVFLIDRESSLDFNLDNDEEFSIHNFEAEFDSGLIPSEYRESIQFKKEKQDILKKIAKDDLFFVEKILNKYVTSNQLEGSKQLITKMIEKAEGEDKQTYLTALKAIDSQDPKAYSLDSIIKEIRIEHRKLRQELNIFEHLEKAIFFKPDNTIKKNTVTIEKSGCHYPAFF